MTDLAQRYLELEKQLYEGRLKKTLSDEEDDDLCEEMGDMWWDLTDKERDEANARGPGPAP